MLYSLLSLSIVSLLLGVFVYKKTQKSAQSIAFLFFAISISIWIFCNFLLRIFDLIIYLRAAYAMGLIVAIMAVLWAFMFVGRRTPPFFKYFVFPTTVLFFLITVSTDAVIADMYSISTLGYLGKVGNYFWLHSLLFSSLVGGLMVILFATYRNSKDQVLRHQILIVSLGLIVTSTVSLFVSFILPFVFHNLNYVTLDNFSSAFFLVAIAYAILRYQLFNIRLILVEIALLFLNMFMFLNIFTSHTKIDNILNISVFVAVIVFSTYLILGIKNEIRDREKIEELVWQKAKANERLRLMETQKTEFVSIASHQLRTPVTIIKGYTSMILEGTFGSIDAVIKEAVEKLYLSSSKVVSLVEDLLTVSRIEQGRTMLTLKMVDFGAYARAVVQEMEKEAFDAKIYLSFSSGAEDDIFVFIDETKLKQAIRYIIDNAIKFTTGPGFVYITASFDRVVGKVRLTISDTGLGMTRSQISEIFDRYNLQTADVAQGEDEVVSENHVHGIGLYIAQEIIEAHHGTLRIESAGTGSGTTVIIELPPPSFQEVRVD